MRRTRARKVKRTRIKKGEKTRRKGDQETDIKRKENQDEIIRKTTSEGWRRGEVKRISTQSSIIGVHRAGRVRRGPLTDAAPSEYKENLALRTLGRVPVPLRPRAPRISLSVTSYSLPKVGVGGSAFCCVFLSDRLWFLLLLLPVSVVPLCRCCRGCIINNYSVLHWCTLHCFVAFHPFCC